MDPQQHTYLACALLMRGNVVTADLNRNISRLKSQIRMAPWNEDAFKTGICKTPPAGELSFAAVLPILSFILLLTGTFLVLHPHPFCRAGVPFSLTCLANNCAIVDTLKAMQQRFTSLFRKKLYVHHYEEYEDMSYFQEAHENLRTLVDEYHILDDLSQFSPPSRFYPTYT